MNSRKILFICPTNPQPSGGVKQIYKMVDLLNRNGFDASVVHKKNGYREKWFPNETKVINNRYLFKSIKYLDRKKLSILKKLKLAFLKKISFTIDANSILVFPEIYSFINSIEPQNKKVIFNQNCYYTFNGFSNDSDLNNFPYKHPNTLATIVVSEDSKNYLESISNHNLYRLRLGINHEIFSYSDEKKMEIAFMPRKLSDDITQVLNVFKIRNPNSIWKFIPIDNKSEIEVADIFRTSLFFLSFNEKEGFGLPPVEAMSCGCYVIGYRGQAGREYLHPSFSSPVEDGNIIQFVEKIEEAIDLYEHNPLEILSKAKMASVFISQNYNLKNEEEDTVRTWQNILKL